MKNAPDDARRDLDAWSRNRAVSARLAGTTGAVLFFVGAAIALLASVLPHPEGIRTSELAWLAAAEICFGFVLLAWSRLGGRSRRWLGPVTIGGAIAAITAAIYLSSRGEGAVPALAEFFYVWPALYAGYFFKPRAIVIAVVATIVAYGAVQLDLAVSSTIVAIRILIVTSVVAGTAAVAHVLRRHVNALVGGLDRLARTDILTGLVNRRGFDERLEDELQRYRRGGGTVALLVGDIDRFKGINDRFGHAAGDHVLSEVGRVLLDSARSIDTTARIGGEEFAIVMPDTGGLDAVDAAERLREAIARVEVPTGESVELTFGVASTDNPGCNNSDALLSAADAALYAAKAQGRNRTLAFRGRPPTPAAVGD